jgi:molybdopterin converting factor small subunit
MILAFWSEIFVSHLKVIVKLLAELRKAFGSNELQLTFNREHVTLKEAIDQLLLTTPGGEHAAKIVLGSPSIPPFKPGGNKLNPALIVLINEVDYRLSGGMASMLSDDDNIVLLPTIHGG